MLLSDDGLCVLRRKERPGRLISHIAYAKCAHNLVWGTHIGVSQLVQWRISRNRVLHIAPFLPIKLERERARRYQQYTGYTNATTTLRPSTTTVLVLVPGAE